MYFKSPQLHWQINKSIRFYSIHKGSDNKKEGNKELDPGDLAFSFIVSNGASIDKSHIRVTASTIVLFFRGRNLTTESFLN